ncbi:MAG: ActS/PrrB/RegB family redox-sensitive histidine kinase [Paracoccaceae bacterium]
MSGKALERARGQLQKLELANRSNWVRLQTLILLRWMAISGQLGAILIARYYLGIQLPLVPCLALVLLSAVANLLAGFLLPKSRRLSQTEALLFLLFDSFQLAALLSLTGGLNNPFALLILAPTTIAATALEDRATAIVGALTVTLVSALALFHLPLLRDDGSAVSVPPLFGFGFWLAIVVGIVFLALYARRVSTELNAMSEALLATQMALAREQKLTDLSGVVAAAAHELGTPLATIKLTSSELVDELADHPSLQSDAALINRQADRCRDILRAMGRAGNDDLHMRSAPFSAVVSEAAEPHRNRVATVHLALPESSLPQPLILRQPEIIHGLRNLIQNAVDFSNGNVWLDLDWSKERLSISVIDDGQGFSPDALAKIGDPFMRPRGMRSAASNQRKDYEGMGLGLFIAKTLLERTGAGLTFANNSDPFLREDERGRKSGARVDVSWPRAAIEARPGDSQGSNRPFPLT